MTIPQQRTAADIRADLAEARASRITARDACRHSPNAQTIGAVREASKLVDDLLDELGDALRATR